MEQQLIVQYPASQSRYIWLLLGGSYLISYFYVDLFLISNYKIRGYEQFAFVLLFFTAGECLARVVFRQSHRPYPKEATFWLVCGLCIGAAFALSTFLQQEFPSLLCWNDRYSDGSIHLYAALVVHGIAAYWVVCRFGQLYRAKTGGWFALDLCNAVILFPFGGFFLRIKCFWSGLCYLLRRFFVHKLEKKPLVATLVTLVLFGGFFGVALRLLSESDAVFANFLMQFQLSFSWDYSLSWREFWGTVLLSLPVGAYLFALFARCLRQTQHPSAVAQELQACIQSSKVLRLVSPRTLAAIIFSFVGLYLLYFGVQIEYYLAAFYGQLPVQLTFSEYARQGFFELCKLMALNFVVLFVAAKLSAIPLHSASGLRRSGYALLGCSLLFAATAIAKLVLYIAVYGFTDLRLLSAWWIAVLVVAVFLAIQKMHHAKAVVHRLIYFATASFTFLCFLGV